MDANSLHLEEMAEKIEVMKTPDPRLVGDIAAILNQLIPATGGQTKIGASDLSSTDQMLHLIDAIAPGWSIRVKGKAFEPDGHWSCSLRSSETRDEDEFIGHAKGPHLSLTLVAALLRVLAYRARRAR
ncbi:MAG: hypothetical protein WCC57_02660 [Paracoccaceae bacterium]